MASSFVDENDIIHLPSGNAMMAVLEESIIADRLVVTMFGASWSEPSKVAYDMMVQQKKALPDVVFSKLDTDENKEMATLMVVSILPTFLFFGKGKEVGRIKRPADPETFHQKVLSFLNIQQP